MALEDTEEVKAAKVAFNAAFAAAKAGEHAALAPAPVEALPVAAPVATADPPGYAYGGYYPAHYSYGAYPYAYGAYHYAQPYYAYNNFPYYTGYPVVAAAAPVEETKEE